MMLAAGVWLHLRRETIFFSPLILATQNPLFFIDRLSLGLVAAGTFILVMSFLGCCGACTESVCFLAFYVFLLLVTLSIQLCFLTMSQGIKSKIMSEIGTEMSYQVKNLYNSTGKVDNTSSPHIYKLTTAWDQLQVTMNCCGSQGPQDYKSSSWFNHTIIARAGFVPPSCCINALAPNHSSDTQCQVEAMQLLLPDYHSLEFAYIRYKGCHRALVDWARKCEEHKWMLHVVLLIQIIDLVYACTLMSWLKKTTVDYLWCEEEDFR